MVALRNGMLVAAVGVLQLVTTLTAQPGVTMPTAAVLGLQLNDTGCFVHYNMATMAVHASPPRPNLQGCQDGVTAPPQISSWQPTALDTDAWVSTCKPTSLSMDVASLPGSPRSTTTTPSPRLRTRRMSSQRLSRAHGPAAWEWASITRTPRTATVASAGAWSSLAWSSLAARSR